MIIKYTTPFSGISESGLVGALSSASELTSIDSFCKRIEYRYKSHN